MRNFDDYRLAPEINERAFTEHVRRLAIEGGWLYYHTFDARHSAPGFPDCVMVRGDSLVFAELKDAKGKTTAAQDAWGRAVRTIEWMCGDVRPPKDGLPVEGNVPRVEYHVWRPADMPAIARRLLG